MTESLINEWLADCKDVPPSELHTFANTLSQDNEIVRALYVLLEERTKYSELMDTVCNQLYNFYRSREIELQRFTLQFLPTLIYIYLNSAAHGDIKSCRSLETLLIGLYNLEVVDKSGQQKAVSFRLPSLAMLSIYHEPASLAPASLTESAVRRFEECNTKLVSWGPLQQVETLNAQNRLKVMTALLFIYNQQIGYINKFALEQLCKVATKLVTQGFMKPGHHQRSSYGSESSFVPRILPRIPVSSQFLLEFLHAVYFAMYNDCWCVGNQAAEDIHNRACYEAYPNVMLVTNAIRNSASSGAPGQPSDGPIGVALSPATAAPAISKSMITNASFRTKKLPDDLDEKLFVVELSNYQVEKQEQPAAISGNNKRRLWHWKHTLPNPIDKKDMCIGRAQSSTSLDSSRRGSVCSNSQNSPIRSSPRKSKDQQLKKTAAENKDDIGQKTRKDSGVKCDSAFPDDRLAATNAHLYSVLEERALGELIHEPTENVYMEGNSRSVNFYTTAALSSNIWYYHLSYNTITGWHDIPIQVIRDEITNEGKSNLVSITEEQESTEPNRVGSMRQSKDQKTVSKITNFPVLGKKPKEKEGKITKNAHVTSSEKEKKLGSQATSKETTKGSVSMLNNEAEIEGNVNGCAIRKKNNSVENNAIIIDPSVALIESERLALSNDVTDGSNMENSLNLRAHNETESLNPSIQVSSV
ncbi:uncharacterized protein LOC105275162 isoform X2 [Ooceraea biroi]|uniref:uncharacterized protein LOC105275162 isoform X2 n=1 Tax=Ooceraea biroi TaxID=2015173 RepID=UPI000F0925C3|nr:uncharacterized protein LOC105275162 isoform X2 [Ooceraea biroi]